MPEPALHSLRMGDDTRLHQSLHRGFATHCIRVRVHEANDVRAGGRRSERVQRAIAVSGC